MHILMTESRGTGIVTFWPAAFLTLNTVSSALFLGMCETGGNQRRVSFNTLRNGVSILDAGN